MRHKRTAAVAFMTAMMMFIAGCAGTGETVSQVPAVTGTPVIQTVPVTQKMPSAVETTTVSEETWIEGYTPRSGSLNCLYYDDREFAGYERKSVVYDADSAPLCGVAPHHLTAGFMIAGMYRTVAAQKIKPDTVILTATKHYMSPDALCTSRKNWSTAFGTLENDVGITDMFIERLGAAEDDEMTEFDHSASSHIPFIRRFLPDAKVACLLVSPDAGRDFPEKLAALLKEISETRNCFFAFSIDFSHYLDPGEADIRDIMTYDAVKAGDTAAIERFTNDNVDSPLCLSTFVRISHALGADIWKADGGNTWSIGAMPYSRSLFPDGVTSYFVLFSAKEHMIR